LAISPTFLHLLVRERGDVRSYARRAAWRHAPLLAAVTSLSAYIFDLARDNIVNLTHQYLPVLLHFLRFSTRANRPTTIAIRRLPLSPCRCLPFAYLSLPLFSLLRRAPVTLHELFYLSLTFSCRILKEKRRKKKSYQILFVIVVATFYSPICCRTTF